MAFSVHEIQPTPNPNAAKFILDQTIAEQPTSFLSAGSAKDHPLARRLFEVPGISSLLMLGDFITINKSPAARWEDITDPVRKILSSAT
jgi:hypothetical protein